MDSPLEQLDDAALVRACLSGRCEAFDVVVERHRRQIYQLCYRFVGNHEDASDLAQDVFVRAYRALRRFKGQSAVATWLYRIGVNVCLNRAAAAEAARHADPADVSRAAARGDRRRPRQLRRRRESEFLPRAGEPEEAVERDR